MTLGLMICVSLICSVCSMECVLYASEGKLNSLMPSFLPVSRKNGWRAVSVWAGESCQSSRGPRFVRVLLFATELLNCTNCRLMGSTNGVSIILRLLVSRRSDRKRNDAFLLIGPLTLALNCVES